MTAVKYVPLTEDESAALLEMATDGRPLPLAFGAGGVALSSDGSGRARWALEALAEMRGVDLSDIC